MNSRQALCILACLSASASASSQSAAIPDDDREIVVTAQRIGVPFWTVTGPATTVILIPAEARVPGDEARNLAALTKVMRDADQLIYPGSSEISLSPFKMIGYAIQWRKMSRLPAGTTLESLLGPHDYRRLVALHHKGLASGRFDRKHPFPLSVELKEKAFGKRQPSASISTHVNSIAKQYRLQRIPPLKEASKPYAQAFFRTDPRAYVPCLRATLNAVEGGRPASLDYARYWQERQIAQIMASPVFRAFELCIPPALRDLDRPDVRPQIRAMMDDRRTTVAVVPLMTLAQPGGVLDDLRSAGYEITGPDWK